MSHFGLSNIFKGKKSETSTKYAESLHSSDGGSGSDKESGLKRQDGAEKQQGQPQKKTDGSKEGINREALTAYLMMK
jgi:hypothetical protein